MHLKASASQTGTTDVVSGKKAQPISTASHLLSTSAMLSSIRLHPAHPTGHLPAKGCGAAKVGCQSSPRQQLSGFTSHPAMADASIHLAAVPDIDDSQPTRVPVGVGCVMAANGAPPASCWSIADSMPAAAGAAPPTSIYMQPNEPHAHADQAPRAGTMHSSLVIADLMTKQMASAVPAAKLDAVLRSPDTMFDVQWQANSPLTLGPMQLTSLMKLTGSRSFPIWQTKDMSLGGKSRVNKVSPSNGMLSTGAAADAHRACRAGLARSSNPAAACASQMQAVQTCLRSQSSAPKGPESAGAVHLVALAPGSMQLQECAPFVSSPPVARSVRPAGASSSGNGIDSSCSRRVRRHAAVAGQFLHTAYSSLSACKQAMPAG